MPGGLAPALFFDRGREDCAFFVFACGEKL